MFFRAFIGESYVFLGMNDDHPLAEKE